ncbi:MAG: hypothetical protein SPK70_06090 [Succinivibrio dextrinosolvens]|nr:hypothetical protein [Succinivibrio dextrinosolvens]MDY6465835.1 hypothetical protein [Succinivibrio dextrinosolvens]MDY6470618.1 hypothetical protein [Succinivibrio dextrinosolvens]
MTETKVKDYYVFQNLTEQILNNLKHSLKTLEKDPYYLETLCLENFCMGNVIRNAVLLLSDFLVDRESLVPVVHKIIIDSMDEMDLEETHWEMDSKQHLIEFTKKLVEHITQYYSIEITSNLHDWNIEEGLEKKELLYASLITTKKIKYSIKPYKIKNLDTFQHNLFKFLAPSLVDEKVIFEETKPVVDVVKKEIPMPMFRIVEE